MNSRWRRFDLLLFAALAQPVAAVAAAVAGQVVAIPMGRWRSTVTTVFAVLFVAVLVVTVLVVPVLVVAIPMGRWRSTVTTVFAVLFVAVLVVAVLVIAIPTSRWRSTVTAVTAVAGSVNWPLARRRLGFRDGLWMFFAYTTFARPNWDANSWW